MARQHMKQIDLLTVTEDVWLKGVLIADMKKLYRSRRDSMIAGVAGGIGEHLQVDPTLVRLVFAGITLFSCGAGILFYILAVIIIPLEDID